MESVEWFWLCPTLGGFLGSQCHAVCTSGYNKTKRGVTHQLRYQLLQTSRATDMNSGALGKLNLSNSQNVATYFTPSLIQKDVVYKSDCSTLFQGFFVPSIIAMFHSLNNTELALPALVPFEQWYHSFEWLLKRTHYSTSTALSCSRCSQL